jgi:hypothetical protein
MLIQERDKAMAEEQAAAARRSAQEAEALRLGMLNYCHN